MILKTEFFLAFRYLFRGKMRHISFINIISCLGIMLGVSTLIIVTSVMNGFDNGLMSKLMRFNYHMTIESVRGNISDDVIDEVRKTKGVISASPFLRTQIFGRFDNYIVPIVIRGIDFSNPYERKTFSKYIVEDKKGRGFFIGEGLKKRFLLTSKMMYYPLRRRLKIKEGRIRGIFKVGLYDIDNNYAICGLEEAKKLSKNYLLSLGVRVKEPFHIMEIKNRLKYLENKGFIINTWIEANNALFSALKLEKVTMFVILSLIVIVASFNIFSALTVKVVEKTKDIGVLRALGFSSSKILLVFSIQGTILGAIGIILGTVLGISICFFLKEYHFIKLPQEIYYISYLPVLIKTRDVALISSLSLLISFVSSLFPSIKASRLKPSEALRYE